MASEPRRTRSRGRSPCPRSPRERSGTLRMLPAREARRRPGEPGQPVRGDPPQPRLDGARPGRRPGRQGRAWPRSRRVVRAGDPRRRPGARARQAPDVHERLRARGPPAAAELSRAARRPAGRRGRLRAPVRQAAVPRGRVARRPQRPALDHRRPQQREVQPPPGRHRRARAAAPSTTSSAGSRADETARLPILLDASAEAVETWVRQGTSKAANRFNAWDLQAPAAGDAEDDADRPAAGEVGGPADSDGVRRTKTGWRRILPGRRRGGSREGRSHVSDRYRGRTTRQRNVAEQGRARVGRATGRRRGQRAGDRSRRRLRRGRGRAARSGGQAATRRRWRPPPRPAPSPPGRGDPARRRRRAEGRPPRAGPRRAPAAPPRDRLVRLAARAARRGRRGAGDARPARRPDVGAARREVVPRRGPRPRGERGAGLLGRARRRDRRPGGGGARRVARRPVARRRPRAADLARLRAQRARPRRDRRPRRGPRRVALRDGARSSWRASRRCSRRPSRPDDLPAQPRTLKAGTRIGMDALLAELLERGYAPVLEVAGRGEFARRGGIVDVFPPSAALPIRIEFFGDEIDSLRAFDPTDQRSVGTVRRPDPAARDRVPAAARRRGRVPVAARAARVQAAGAAGARPRPVRGRRGPGATGRGGDRRSRARRRRRGRGLGAARGAVDRPRPPRPRARCSCSTSRATSPTPPPSCGARPTSGTPSSWSRASCRATGRRRSCPRSTGSGASTARGRWSSPGSPRRSMRRAWPMRRRA